MSDIKEEAIKRVGILLDIYKNEDTGKYYPHADLFAKDLEAIELVLDTIKEKDKDIKKLMLIEEKYYELLKILKLQKRLAKDLHINLDAIKVVNKYYTPCNMKITSNSEKSELSVDYIDMSYFLD